MNIERRKSPRTQPEKLTYIHLQADNGAIILNFSEDGLCFRSAVPILETGSVRFTFSMQSGQQPQAIGEVVWTDKARKKGGLRLTEFPADATNPLNVRLDRPPSQRLEKKRSDSIPVSNEPATKVLTLEKDVVPNNNPAPAKAVSLVVTNPVRVPPTVPPRSIVRIATVPKQIYRLPRIPWDSWRDWPTINWGVVGFAVFIIFAVVFVRAYADRFGQSSAYGQTNGGTLSSAEQQSPVSASETAQDPSPLQELRAQIAALESESGQEGSARSTDAGAGSVRSDLSERNDSDPPTNAAEDPATDSKVDTPAQSAQTDSDTVKAALTADAAPNSDAVSTGAADISEVSADPASATYYDVGNFKDLARADKASNDLEKLGFRAIVVHKTILWMSSFHVVVGPFGSDQDTETVRSKLETLGFSPRVAKTH